MKIITWNVNGLRAVHKKGYFERILEEKPDILCIQETKSRPEQLPEEVLNVPGYTCHFHFPTVKKGYSGVAIYTRVTPETVQNDLGIEEMDQEGRLIMAQFKDFILINCYFPNGGGAPERLRYKLDFYDHFLKYVDMLHKKQSNIIFCGDINVAHKEIDLARPKANETHVGFLPIERAWLDRVLKNGWIDVFRHFYPDKEGAYTYWDMKSFSRDRNVGWRIDYFFVSPEMMRHVKSIKILDEILGSDHCPVELILK